MGKHLLRAFATHDPDRFTRLLGASGDPDETTAILTDIPDGLEADVVNRLSPEAANRLLQALSDEIVIGWLTTAAADAGRGLLQRVNRDRATRLISGIKNRSKRRELRRLFEYPPGSIGELLQVNMVATRATMPVLELGKEIQRYAASPEAPVAILHDDGTVKGVLDLVAYVQNRDPAACADDFCLEVRPVFAEAPQSSVKDRIEWTRMLSLPVVDSERQLIGYVSRHAVDKATSSVSEVGVFLATGIELSKRFLNFMIYALVFLLDRRPKR